MKERVHWIDIAKGLMIIGMVLNHIINYSAKMGVDISAFPWPHIGSAYGVFTMQSFFILSGYTTNFNQDFKTFMWKQVKGLLIPYVSFMIIFSTIANFVWGEPFVEEMYGEKYFFLVEGFWFLSALFVAKVLMYFISKISKRKIIELGGGILLLILGIAISECYADMPEPSHWHNWFHYRNGLCMAVFLPIGYYLKKYQVVEKYGLKIGLVYCVCYGSTYLMTLLDIDGYQYLAAPNYTHYLVPNLRDVNGFLLIPGYLFYTVTGSILVFWLSQKIGKSKVLEFYGKTSLVIYCVHFTVLKFFIGVFSSFIKYDSLLGSGCLFALLAVSTLLASCGLAKLFKKRPLSFLIGKF